MRISRRRVGAAIAGLLLVVLVGLGAIAFVRWEAAGVPHAISPPAGAVTQVIRGEGYERVVVDRAHIIALGLRSERGTPTVRPPPASENRDGRPDLTFLIIGSGRGD